jgi:hypothetical protein
LSSIYRRISGSPKCWRFRGHCSCEPLYQASSSEEPTKTASPHS